MYVPMNKFYIELAYISGMPSDNSNQVESAKTGRRKSQTECKWKGNAPANETCLRESTKGSEESGPRGVEPSQTNDNKLP